MKFAVIDLETDPFKRGDMPAAFAAGFYDGQRMDIFFDSKIPEDGDNWYGKKVCRQVVKRAMDFGGAIYLHNGGKFDLYHLLDFLPRSAIEVTHPIGSRLVSLKCGDTTFLDSYALVPKPLKSWGKKDISYTLLDRKHRLAHRSEIIEYLKEDLRQLYSMMEEFLSRFGKNLTLASTAFSVMKKQFGIKLPNTTEFHDERFRPWYFAGRVQFFGLGKFVGNFRILDINSAFPYGMTFPHWFSGESEMLDKMPDENPEHCFYYVDCFAGGAIPFRNEDGSVSFPLGRGLYNVCGWELCAGVRLGKITKLKILRVYRPEAVRSLEEFVNHFYEQKRAAKISGDKATEYFSKILLNAGYGKFALNPRVFKDVAIRKYRSCPCGKNHVDGPPCAAGWEITWDDESRGISFYQRSAHGRHDSKPARYYNVCTAASITAFVRAMLFDALSKCRRPLYCDTDSVIAEGTEALPLGDGLGQWKHEMDCDVVWIGGKKIYVAHNAAHLFRRFRPALRGWFRVAGHGWALPEHFKCAAKGVRLHVRDLIAVCEGEARTSHFDAPSYSPFSAPRFVSRTINRADRQIKASHPAKLAS